MYLWWTLSLYIYLVFTPMPAERQLWSLLLCLCDVFQVLINSLVCWFCTGALGFILFRTASWQDSDLWSACHSESVCTHSALQGGRWKVKGTSLLHTFSELRNCAKSNVHHSLFGLCGCKVTLKKKKTCSVRPVYAFCALAGQLK